MKRVLTLVISGLGAIALTAPVSAQAVNAQSDRLGAAALSVDPTPTRKSATGLDSTTLNAVANSISTQVSPANANPGDRPIPDNLIPEGLIRTPSRILPETHPLEAFQPPAPNRSVGINLNRL